MFVVIILFALRILSINCDLKIIDPKFPEFSNIDFNPTKMLSSASPYDTEENCTPKKAWLLIRHGAKYPSEDVLNGISFLLVPKIQEKILSVYANESDQNFSKLTEYQKQMIQRIKKWKNIMASGTHKALTKDGKLMMKELGKRWNDKLKKLTKHLMPDEIKVLSAEEDRCVISGKKFLSTFYEGDYDEIDVIRTSDDARLKLVKPDKRYVKVPNPSRPKDLIFVEELHFRKYSPPTIQRIQKILFPEHIDKHEEYRTLVTDEVVRLMYEACAHSIYHKDENGTKTDAWCTLFNYEDFKMFEEMNDLKYYNHDGYHYKYNNTMGNAITYDLLRFITESNGLKFKLFIGHTSNILSVITRFDLFRDNVNLTVDNIQNIKNRKWRSSFMTPLGCNIMVVIYDCGFETLSVSFYLNEIPIKMVMDDGNACVKCPIEDFKRKLIGFKLEESLNLERIIKTSNLDSKQPKRKLSTTHIEIKDLDVTTV